MPSRLSGIPGQPSEGAFVSLRNRPVDFNEISAHRLERVLFLINLSRRSNAATPQNGDWWAPALYGVLKKERQDKAGNGEELAIHKQSEHDARKSEGRGVHFEQALDIPLAIQLSEPLGDPAFALAGVRGYPAAGRYFYPLIHSIRGIRLDAILEVHTSGSQALSRLSVGGPANPDDMASPL